MSGFLTSARSWVCDVGLRKLHNLMLQDRRLIAVVTDKCIRTVNSVSQCILWGVLWN